MLNGLECQGLSRFSVTVRDVTVPRPMMTAAYEFEFGQGFCSAIVDDTGDQNTCFVSWQIVCGTLIDETQKLRS
jgi:hypothetical protein